ncbi:hypothetical protein TCAL_04725 [Tigriopus californicus]|uniref:EGF-like domain-containing protein n=1 Tax=Tigriopus californicus TaxID=6832 RepID=A0A553PTC8_TIGCA|nr:hypothetical protein TCAL_04725 [Tigriopus californicus]
MWSKTLLVVILAIAVQEVVSQCSRDTCGPNTNCRVQGSAAVCRCNSGWDHAPGGNTIEGCTVRISDGQRSSGISHRATPPRTSFGTLSNRLGNNRIRSGSSSVGSRQNFNDGGDPCAERPCGLNAECTSQGNRAVCSCPPRYEGDPNIECTLDPCETTRCGVNAECERRGNQAICTCPPGFNGDPLIRCDDNPCNSSPCHPNADCQVQGTRAVCKCRQNFEGDGIIECSLDPCLNNPCGTNAECQRTGSSYRCVCPRGYSGNPQFRCNSDPCGENPCGPNAVCNPNGNVATCVCAPGYLGDPLSREGCYNEPCSTGPCGVNAECESRGRSALCRCPRAHTGDPYTRCKFDPCAEAPCGVNAVCNEQGEGYECVCPPDYTGNGYGVCTYNPCATSSCGPNTDCNVIGERAVCRCISGYRGSPNSRSGCLADPCSIDQICHQNAECTNQGGQPVCSCAPGYVGDGFHDCFRGNCLSNDDCGSQEACQEYQCVDPCASACGSGAECEVNNHVAICRCPRGLTGDPFQNCRRFTREEICGDACGPNTDCTVNADERPVCKCLPNYIGNPLTGCRYECTSDRECPSAQKCSNFNCVAVCDSSACGENANCRAINNRAECTCPEDFQGDPYTRCFTECVRHNDCPENTACIKFRCQDPCYALAEQQCAPTANCEVKNHKPICSCFTGDPFRSCREFNRDDLCKPNPCGVDAICQPGYNNRGSDKPVCTCPSGYRGNPLVRCTRGDCERDSDCGSNLGCYNFNCEDPCRRGACAPNAECQVRNHAAACSCPDGYYGNALEACRPTQANTRVVGHSNSRNRFRFKRFVDNVLSYLY